MSNCSRFPADHWPKHNPLQAKCILSLKDRPRNPPNTMKCSKKTKTKKTYKIGLGTENKQEKCVLDSVADREEIMIHGLFTRRLDLRQKRSVGSHASLF